MLFNKIRIKDLELKNHFVRSATWENLADEKGNLNDELYRIYKVLAKNEVGLIITGYANILEKEQPNPGMMGIYNDNFIVQYKKLTKIVHEYDSKIILQLAYGGTKTTFNVGSREIFAPSDVPEKATGVIGKVMSVEDIKEVVEAFASASKRAKEAGFDGVEIHGAHTYLINQFLSPYYNQRSDQYGGNLENRTRILKEIIEKIQEYVGSDFPIFVKLTCSDFFDGGLTFEESILVCKAVENMGVSAIELTGNVHGKANTMIGERFDGQEISKDGYFMNFVVEAKKQLSIPLIAVGGLRDIDLIQNYAYEGIELFALSRPLLAEPNLIKRWKDGDIKKAKCISCSKCRTPEGNYCTIFK